MTIPGYINYKSREFCNDVKCEVQLKLNSEKDFKEYEKIRQTCKTNCKYSAWQFHHWLMDKGYLILKLEKIKEV